jgi:aminoglycoside 3-N-acetyltransferase
MEDYRLIDEKEIYNSFNKIIKKTDTTIVLYSGVWSFINKIHFKKDIGKKILDIVEKIVTPNRTLILPSFSSGSFIKNLKFDLKKSFDNKNGIIPQEALKRNYYYRTPQPLHSYLVFGKKINEIKKLQLKTSWGKTSILEWIAKKNSRICVLGIPWNKGCSYLHRFEEKFQVPWRYYKEFNGKMYNNNKYIRRCNEKKYSSPSKIILNYDYKPLVNLMEKKKIFIEGSSKFFLQSAKTKHIDKIANVFFKASSKWKIIKNKSKVRNWIDKFKNDEIMRNN